MFLGFLGERLVSLGSLGEGCWNGDVWELGVSKVPGGR